MASGRRAASRFGTGLAPHLKAVSSAGSSSSMRNKFVRQHWLTILSAFAALFLAAMPVQQARADGFTLGTASNYALLFEGGGNNTLQITNVTTNTTGGVTGVAAGQGGGIGNIGVGNTGKVSLSGPGNINGNLDVAASNSGQVTG